MSDYDGFMDAINDDDPDTPTPVPCATEGCDGENMDYEDGVYTCPICGRMVYESDMESYLSAIVNDEDPDDFSEF